MSAQGKLIAVVALLAVLFILLFQNSHSISIRLFVWTFSLPANLMIPLVGFMGFLLGLLVSSIVGRTGQKTKKRI